MSRHDTGTAGFKRKLRRVMDASREELTKALIKSAEETARAQRALVPVDTGALRDSITVTGPGQRTPAYSQPGGSEMVPENQVWVTAGNQEVRTGHLVEYGTKHAPAQPWFWPGYRITSRRNKARHKRALSKAVRENWTGS